LATDDDGTGESFLRARSGKLRTTRAIPFLPVGADVVVVSFDAFAPRKWVENPRSFSSIARSDSDFSFMTRLSRFRSCNSFKYSSCFFDAADTAAALPSSASIV
jgi:hypothetical protein